MTPYGTSQVESSVLTTRPLGKASILTARPPGKASISALLFCLLMFLFRLIFGCSGSLLLHCPGCHEWGLFSSCWVWPPHCGGLSSFRARASVVVALRLSHSVACGIFPDQGSNLCPLHWRQIHWQVRWS